MFGRDPPYIGDIPSLELTHVSVDCERWFEDLDKLRKSVQPNVTRVHERMSSNFQRSHGRPEYQIGDEVWVKNTKTRTNHHKIDPLWTGPCEVLERYGRTGRYKVSLQQGAEDVHMEKTQTLAARH